MTMIDDGVVISDPETTDAEVLFKEAKRRERVRRMGIAAIVLLAIIGAALAVTIGGGGTRPAHKGSSGPPSRGPVSPVRLWSQAGVLKAMLADTPVALPNSRFAYGITVASTSPTSPWGRLTRIHLATGQRATGPRLPSGSTIFVLGNSIAVLSPTSETTAGRESGPWIIRSVVGTSFGRALMVPPITVSRGPLVSGPVTVSHGPLVGGRDFWFGSGDFLSLLNVSTGVVLRTVNLGAPIASISVDPARNLLYVGLDELATHPLAKVTSVVNELNATTGRLLSHADFDFTLGPIGVDAVRGGVWVAYRGGMAGSAELLHARNLVAAASPPAHTAQLELKILAGGGEPAVGGIWPTPVGSSLWLWAAHGTGCVAPASGVFLAGTAFPAPKGQIEPWSPFAEWNGHVYATEEVPLTGATEVVVVTVPRVCR